MTMSNVTTGRVLSAGTRSAEVPTRREAPARDAPGRAPGWVQWPMVHRTLAAERHLPAWLHPTYRGAVCVLGLIFGLAGRLFLLALLLSLMFMVGPGPGGVLFLKLLAVTAVGGAVGGTIHGILRPLDELGRAGLWLRWFVAIFGAIVVAVVLTPAGPFSLKDPAFHVIALGLAALGASGLLAADDRRPGRLTRRGYQLCQSHDQLWAAGDRRRAGREPPLPDREVAGAPPGRI